MTAPLLLEDAPVEVVAPVRRELPPLRPAGRPPRVAAVLAVLGALVASAVAALAPAPPLAWTLASGSMEADGAAVAADAVVPADVALVAGEDGAVLTAQAARVEVAPGTQFELAPAIGPAAQSLRLRDGALVADVDVILTVDATVATVTGFGGAFRVERDASPRVAAYSAALSVTGDTAVSLTRLQQVPLGAPQAAVRPIVLDPEDPWDARYGERPLEIDATLADLATGLRATYGTAPQSAAFYGDFVGVTDGLVEALPRLAPTDLGATFGPPAETLVAAAVLSSLVEGTGRALPELVAEVVVARAAGATWGVVLAQADLDAPFVRRIADEALRRRAEQADPAPVASEPPAPVTPQPEPEPTPDPEPSPTATPEPPQPPTPPDPPDPPDDEEPDDPGPLEDPIGTLDDLLPGAGGTGNRGVATTVEDLLDGVTGTLDQAVPTEPLDDALDSLVP